MNDETKIFSSEESREENQNTDITGSKVKKDYSGLKIGIGTSVGAAAGILGSHLAWGMSLEDIDLLNLFTDESSITTEYLVFDNLSLAESVNDEMSFQEAFDAAREEIGVGGLFQWQGNVYGTYTKEEWDELSSEEQNEYWSHYTIESDSGTGNDDLSQIDIITEVDIASGITDDMTFGEAFAAARSEIGEGGVFLWNGEYYNTYYKEEWGSMSDAQQDEFLAQVYGEVPLVEPLSDDPLMANAEPIDLPDPEDIDWDSYPEAEPVYTTWSSDESGIESDIEYAGTGEAVYTNNNEPVNQDFEDIPEVEYVTATYANELQAGAEFGNVLQGASEFVDQVDNFAEIVEGIAPDLIPGNVSDIINGADDFLDIFEGDGGANSNLGGLAGNFIIDAFF